MKYKTNAEKCIEANAKQYKRKPVFKRARRVKRNMKKAWDSSIDFRMF